jgi:uncharacterized membrane protein (DUF2068 family)
MPRAKFMPASSKNLASDKVLLLIALFKLVKGFALLAIGVGVLRLMHRDLEQTVMHWVNLLRVDPENHFIHRLLARIFRVSPKELRTLSIGTFLYAGLFLTEGTGLLLRKRWAEYFTIITTSSLIPLEIYELAHHYTLPKLAVLIFNVAIVAYLVINVRKTR